MHQSFVMNLSISPEMCALGCFFSEEFVTRKAWTSLLCCWQALSRLIAKHWADVTTWKELSLWIYPSIQNRVYSSNSYSEISKGCCVPLIWFISQNSSASNSCLKPFCLAGGKECLIEEMLPNDRESTLSVEKGRLLWPCFVSDVLWTCAEI